MKTWNAWTVRERQLVEEAEDWQLVVDQLPRHTRLSIARTWQESHPRTLRGRPPKTPAEQRVAAVLARVRTYCVQHHQQVDVGELLKTLREADWERIGRYPWEVSP